MSSVQTNGRSLPIMYNCSKCPAYCCSYDQIEISRQDVARLAKHFGVTFESAVRKFTKMIDGSYMLRHKRDHIFSKVCRFLDAETRRCTIYDARPRVCRTYPASRRCGYYDFLASERRRQCDDEFIPTA